MTKRDGVKEIEEIIDIIERFRDDIEERHRRIYTGDIFKRIYSDDEREYKKRIAEAGEYAHQRLREEGAEIRKMINLLSICYSRTLEDADAINEKTRQYMRELGMRRKGEKSLFDYESSQHEL